MKTANYSPLFALLVGLLVTGPNAASAKGVTAWQRVVHALVQAPAAAQQPTPIACLHGANESSEQRDRRTAAIRVARMINSAEANGRTPYRPLATLNVPVPEGWEARLVTDGASYSFSVKDRTDPCLFTLFSDENGLIYIGEAMR